MILYTSNLTSINKPDLHMEVKSEGVKMYVLIKILKKIATAGKMTHSLKNTNCFQTTNDIFTNFMLILSLGHLIVIGLL